MMLFSLLLFVNLMGSLAQEDLSGKVFVFPRPSDNYYVLLKPVVKDQLQRFTLCLSFFTDLTRTFCLFSAASRLYDNELSFFKYPDYYEIWVGGQSATFRAAGNTNALDNRWENACVTWDSTTGVVQFWLDGQPSPRKGVAKGYKIQTELVVMLGQEQDSYGGSLDAQQSFVGEAAEIYLWDTVLPPEQLRWKMWDTVPKSLVNWTALNFEIKGYVVMEPTLQ